MRRRRFYTTGPGVELYDALHAGPHGAAIRGDVAWYVSVAKRTGGPVLELGCGTGRVTLPIARAGIEVVGLDIAPAMLRIARRKAKDLPAGARVRFVRGDMTRFRIPRRFRLVLIPFRTFQALLTPDEQRRCLRRVRRHLRREGTLVINLFDPRLEFLVPGSPLDRRPAVKVRGDDGRLFELRFRDRRCDPLSQTFRETWEWTERGPRGRVVGRREDPLVMRWTYRQEMRYLLEAEGFDVVACHGDFRGGPPRYGGEQIWVVRKTGKSGRARRDN